MMNNIYYSYDESDFSYETINEAVEMLLQNDSSIKNKDEISIYSGESKNISIKRFTPNIIEYIADQAYDNHEHCGGFPDASEEVENKIQKSVDDLIVKLFDMYGLNPSFFDVEKVKEIKVKIINTDDETFELIK